MPAIDLSRLRVITHSAIRIEGPAGGVYFDPYDLTEAPHDAAYVLFTHAHYDHLSPDDYARVAAAATEIVAPASMADDLVGLAAAGVHLMRAGDVIELGGMRVEAVPAYNTDPSRLQKHPQANGWLGYVVTIDGVRYYVAGDTDQNPENERVACDVALVPIGGTFTMDPAQAAAFVNGLHPHPAVAVPTHYGSIVGTKADADAFAAAVDPAIDVACKLER